MAKAKKASKKNAAILSSKPGKKGYTKGQLIAHLAAATTAKGFGDLSKKQVSALLEELGKTALNYAPVGAVVPGIGKLVLRTIPAKPARVMVSFGKEIKVSAKPKRHKLVFRFSKDAKAAFAK